MTTKPVNYDAEFCGRVPLNQTNLVQPHGVLLVIDKETNVLQASENTEDIFGAAAREVVSKSLSGFLSTKDDTLKNLLDNASPEKQPLVLHLPSGNYPATLYGKETYFILEIEKQKIAAELSFASVYQNVKQSVALIDAAATTEEACRTAAVELKKLSGFDKVMIYRFDEAWNGDVVAEAKEEEMDSYLGLKFPASDVPKQARDLYKRSPYRFIPNVDYEPVKLYPLLNPLTNAFTDLSDSNLRSVAGVHLEYLRNMKVAASMSTRILKDGELWGLIACHHRTPVYLPQDMRAVFELLSAVVTAKIGAVQVDDSLAQQTQKHAQLTKLLQAFYKQEEIKPVLRMLLEADGVATVFGSKIETEGSTPTDHEISDLVVWLRSQEDGAILHQPKLSAVYEPAEAYSEKASGLLALPLQQEGNFILAFRQEEIKRIAWGGNPQEAVQFESDGKKYHPRASFRQWQQTVRQTANPWQNQVLQTASDVQNILSGLMEGH